MKTKELIRRLQEIDPTGELECSVGGEDIFFCQHLPGYYDGSYEVLLRDESKRPYYDVVGVRICRHADKINIRTLSFEDFLLDHPDGLIEYDSESTRALSEKRIERVREETKQMIAEVDAEFAQKAASKPQA